MKPALSTLLTLACACLPCWSAAISLPLPSELPLRPELPDPLVKLDGSRVVSAAGWKSRRQELKMLFQHYMYGHFPPPPRSVSAEVRRLVPGYLGGKATLKEVTLSLGAKGAPRINLLLVVPNHRHVPAPVVLGLNFCGNHTVLEDPAIALPATWMPTWCEGCTNHAATDAGRGKAALQWCVEASIDRGYAVATFYNGDLEPDEANAPTGIRAFTAGGGFRGALRKPEAETRCPVCSGRYQQGDYDWSTLAAWAWGLQRAVDYLVTDRALDRRRIAVFGHSRNGKTALLAGAFDDRISLVLCHQAGCGGSAPSRGKVGEQVRQINANFPHWFNALFKEFSEQPERLPFDQHELIALCAPRPVLLSNATEDTWANPAGQFAMLRAATPVYQLLGVAGFDATEMPPPGTLIPTRLGYFLRTGKHSTTAEDWKAFLDFADVQWGKPSGK